MRANSLLKGNVIFEKYIRKNFLRYILILVVFSVGFLIGIGIFNKNISVEENSINISNYMMEKIEMIGTNASNIISNYIQQDFIELFIVCILSFSIIGVPMIVLIIFTKSISLGITVSAIIHTCGTSRGLSFSILLFLLPAIIKIFVFLILVCSSLKFVENVFKYKKEIKYEIIRHALANIFCFIINCIVFAYRTFSLNIVNQILF